VHGRPARPRHRVEPLVSQGYGEWCPLDNATNPVAWEKNRRVEFKVVKTEDGPTGVSRGCPVAADRGVNAPAGSVSFPTRR
jgi:hypothetical protein